jgi:hypothetical protein
MDDDVDRMSGGNASPSVHERSGPITAHMFLKALTIIFYDESKHKAYDTGSMIVHLGLQYHAYG